MLESHRQTEPLPDSKIPTFEQAAINVLEPHAHHLHPDTIRDHRHVLEQYVFPRIGTLPVSDLTLQHVLDALHPIWREKPAQARKVTTLIRRVLAWACASGFRPDTLNFDVIASVLGAQPKSSPYRVLPHSEVASVLASVRGSRASPSTKLAFEFLVLTAARSGEARGARWDEMDLERAVWTVPAVRMKSRREHRVPLSDEALRVLANARKLGNGEGLVFPNPRGGPLSASSLSFLFRRLGINAVPHSLRASLRDWCAETGVSRDLAELCVGGVLPEPVAVCFSRTDLLDHRREILEDWGAYVTGKICGAGC